MSDHLDNEIRRVLAFEAAGGASGLDELIELVSIGDYDAARALLAPLAQADVVEIAIRLAGAKIDYSVGRREHARLVGIIAREAESLRAVAREHGVEAMSGAVDELRKAADALANPPE